jgi:hypothetical protein
MASMLLFDFVCSVIFSFLFNVAFVSMEQL